MKTVDDFLGGKLQILQPIKGFRAGMDTILLSSTLPTDFKGNVIDVGTGVGTALLSSLWRVKNAEGLGIDIDENSIELAKQNALRNNLEGRTSFMKEDIFSIGKSLFQSFDWVMTNPPFHEGEIHEKADERWKARIIPDEMFLKWVVQSVKLIKPRGYISLISPVSKIPLIFEGISKWCGAINLIPLLPRQNASAKRVLLIARKGVSSPMSLHPGLCLHTQEGAQTEISRKILYEGEALYDLL